MIIRVRLGVSDEGRRAIRHRLGKRGLATRAEITRLVELVLDHDITDAVDELREARARRKNRKIK